MSKKSKTGPAANPEPAPEPKAPVPAEPTATPAPAVSEPPEAQPSLEAAMRDMLEASLTEPEEADEKPEAEEAEESKSEPKAETADEDDEGEAEEPAPESESEEEPKFQDEGEEAQDELEDEAKRKRWPKSYFKRIRKLTDRIDQLESKLTEPREPEQAQAVAEPILDAVESSPEAQQIREEIAKRERNITVLGEYLEKLESGEVPVDAGGRRVPWTAEEIKSARERFGDEIKDWQAELRLVKAEAKRERIRRAGEFARQLEVRHPWIKDKTSRDTQVVETILGKYPILRQIPEARTWLADGLAFQRLLEKARTNAGNGAAPKPMPPKSPPRPTAAPRPAPSRDAEVQNRIAKFMEGGSREDGKALIESLL